MDNGALENEALEKMDIESSFEVKAVYVEAKKSKNFQTYTAGIHAEVDKDRYELAIRALQSKCRKLAQEQIKIDG